MVEDHRGETVIFVHGLWMTGLDLTFLRRQVAQAGYTVKQFHYHTVIRGFDENSSKLRDYIDTIDADRVHFVGHSMAGLVLRHLFADFDLTRTGKVVLLGTPNQGSYVASRLGQYAAGRLILGKSIQAGLLGGAPLWNSTIPLGIIAGKTPLGAGRLFSGLAKPNDGTVAVAETRLEGMSDHAVLPVSHTSMLFSPLVGRYIIHFLKHGRFPEAAMHAD